MSQLLIGAGGWAYFQVPGTDSLEAYSRAFDFVELNSSYYQLPDYAAASDWRARVQDDFQFAIRIPRIFADHYGLKIVPSTRSLLERVEEICGRLKAIVLTLLISATSPIKKDELATRLNEFLVTMNSEATIAVEFRRVRPTQPAFDVMKDAGAIHSVDLSKDTPSYQGKILYSRLFGKGEENIYEFDDGELKDIVKKASEPKFEKSILAFHGVRMYRDAGRAKTFAEKGYFPKITSGIGTDSIREILSEDARFPASRSSLIHDQGWKVFQDTREVRKLSTVLERLQAERYYNLDELLAELRSMPGLSE